MKKRKNSRGNDRGAAMIEAIVVITTLLVFLGMVLWAQRAYAAKIDQAATTRSDVLYFASHDCEKAPPAPDSASAPTYGHEGGEAVATDSANPAEAERLASDLSRTDTGAVAGAGLTRHWNMASTVREQDVDGSAIVNLEKTKLTTHVKTESWAGCNEKNYGGDWNDLAQFVWGMGDNGAGLLGP